MTQSHYMSGFYSFKRLYRFCFQGLGDEGTKIVNNTTIGTTDLAVVETSVT